LGRDERANFELSEMNDRYVFCHLRMLLLVLAAALKPASGGGAAGFVLALFAGGVVALRLIVSAVSLSFNAAAAGSPTTAKNVRHYSTRGTRQSPVAAGEGL